MAAETDIPAAPLEANGAQQTVEALLSASGLNLPAGDVASLVRAYPALQRRIDGLYRVPTGDDSPVSVFLAELGR
jgi:hypothetical protein